METQTSLSQKLKISQSYLSKIVSGKARPRWSQAKRLAAATGIDPIDWLELPPDELRRKLGLPAKRPYRKKTEEVA